MNKIFNYKNRKYCCFRSGGKWCINVISKDCKGNKWSSSYDLSTPHWFASPTQAFIYAKKYVKENFKK